MKIRKIVYIGEQETIEGAVPSAKYTAKIKMNSKLLVTPKKKTIPAKDGKKEEIKYTIHVQWCKADGAAKYKVYAGYCGHKSFKLVKTTKGTSCTFHKLKGKKIDPEKNVKVYVVAYDKNGKKIAKSNEAHAAGFNNPDETNIKSIEIRLTKDTLAVRETLVAETKLTKADDTKNVLAHVKQVIRFAGSNPNVATVSPYGMITGVGKGTCTIYAYAENGRSAKVKVTIK